MQELAELGSLLQPVGLSYMVEQHIMYPGPRRVQLVQAMLKRLLNGRHIDDVSCGAARLPQHGAAEDELFALKCQAVLKLLGINAAPEQIRGCTGQQDQDIAPLLQMARLLSAMEARRAANSSSASAHLHSQQQPSHEVQQQSQPAANLTSIAKLLALAAAQLSSVLPGNTQLFPSDIADVLKAYDAQGALVQLPALCQQAMQKAQQLQVALQQLLADGAGACEGAGSQVWRQLVSDVDKKLQQQLQELRAFDVVYQQELSVWADVASAAPPQQLEQQQLGGQPESWAVTGHSNAERSAESTGKMARNLMLAYQELKTVMDAVSTIMRQHQALQDVPAAALQVQRDQHLSTAHNMRMSASAVRPQSFL